MVGPGDPKPPKGNGADLLKQANAIMQDTPQEPKPKAERPITFGYVVESNLDDAWNMVKGLYDIVPAMGKQLSEIYKGRKYLGQIGAGEVAKGFGENVKMMGKSIVEDEKDIWSRPYLRMPSAIGDALAAYSVLAKSAGITARLAGGVVKANPVTKADKLATLAAKLEKLPGDMARKAIDDSVRGITGGAVDLAKRRDFINLKSVTQGRKGLNIDQDIKDYISKIDALDPAEKELFNKAVVFGDAPEIGIADDVLNANPKVKAAFEAHERYLKHVDPDTVADGVEAFYKRRAMLDDDRMQQAAIKRLAVEADLPEAKAKELYEAASRKPLYRPNVHEGNVKGFNAEALADDLITGGKFVREGKIGSLEKLTGAKGYSKDPSVWARHLVKTFRETQAKAHLSERLLQGGDLIKAREGMNVEGMKPDAIPEGIHRKYYEDKIRAQMLQKITDPTIKRLLKWEYIHKENALTRLYDKVYRFFAKGATRWNPKWYTGNAVGDAILGLLGGADWLRGQKMLKAGAMPPQVRANVNMATLDEGLEVPKKGFRGMVSANLDRATDIVGELDGATRAGIINRSVAQELAAAGVRGEASMEMMEQVLRSTDNFHDLQIHLQAIEERVTRGSATVNKLDREIVDLERRRNKLLEKLKAKEQKVQAGTSEKTGPLLEEAKQLEHRAKHEIAPSVTEWSDEYKDWPEWKKAQDLRAEAAEKGRDASLGAVGQKGFDKGVDVLQRLDLKLAQKTSQRGAIVRDIMDDLVKQGELDKLVPGLKEQVAIARRGVDRAMAFVGDYLGLDGFEQNVVRRLIPFYPWSKAMTMLAFRIPFLAPIKTFLWHRYAQAMMSMTEDPDLPEHMRGYVQAYALEDGRQIWAKATAYSPFEGLRTSRLGDMSMPGIFNVAERNPFISVVFRFAGGKTLFDLGTVPYGEPAVSMADGSVVRFRPDGRLETQIPQTPFVSGLVGMFPITQYLKAIAFPYWSNKYNAAGIPEPAYNPDGSYKYPRELHDRLGALLGVNLMTRKREDLIRPERIKVHKAVQDLRPLYRKTNDPEEREAIVQYMKDYAARDYRHFKAR